MKRRTFIAALGSAAAAWPFVARAEQRTPRIGYLSPDPAAAVAAAYEAFRAGLRDLGYVEGESVEIESRFSDYGGGEQLTALASELVALKVDVIVTVGPGVFAAHSVTKTVPIVAAVSGPLVETGLAESLNHPGGNVTGETFFADELNAKRMALLKQVKPSMTSVGLLVLQGFVFLPNLLRALDAPAKALGVAIEPIEVAGPDDCDRALSAGPGASIGGLVVIDLPPFITGPGPATVAAAAARHGLPAAGSAPFARDGGLVDYGVDFAGMYRRAAAFVDKILKGAKSGDIPIEQATKFVTTVNLKTAKALGLDVPPTLLAAADEVIE